MERLSHTDTQELRPLLLRLERSRVFKKKWLAGLGDDVEKCYHVQVDQKNIDQWFQTW